jgi:hypothetical protein
MWNTLFNLAIGSTQLRICNHSAASLNATVVKRTRNQHTISPLLTAYDNANKLNCFGIIIALLCVAVCLFQSSIRGFITIDTDWLVFLKLSMNSIPLKSLHLAIYKHPIINISMVTLQI